MHIAKTVQSIETMDNPLVRTIMNRESSLTRELAQHVMSQTQLSYHGRRPKPARNAKGQVRKTNLDLLSLLADLHKRMARVELTAYDNYTPWQAYADQQHVGGTKRHGRIMGLVSHSKHLSFSVQIQDQSILHVADGDPTVGAFRTYMIADYHGAWHKGWHGFSWNMNQEEKAYLERRKILIDGNVSYEDYVHLNRRQSIMGAPYLLLKLLHQRLEDEISFLEREIKRLEHAGVESPVDLEPQTRFKLAQGGSQSIEVPTFSMRLDGLEFTGEYIPVSSDELGYRLAQRSIDFLANELRPIVQFMMRADEVAFYRFGLEQDFVSNWIKGSTWDHSSKWAASIALGNTLSLSYQKGLVEKKIAA